MPQAVRFVGWDSFSRALASSPAIFDAAYKPAVGQVASIITSAARARTPTRRGGLRATVRPDTSNTGGVAWGTAYGGVIHYGWPAHSIAPHPFALDGANATRARWLGIIEKANERALEIIGGKAA